MAGADILTAATYQMTPQGLELHRAMQPSDADRELVQAVVLARTAAVGRVNSVCSAFDGTQFGEKCAACSVSMGFVAASVGCFGAYLADGSEYCCRYSSTSVDQLLEWHTRRFRVLEASGADFIACETIPCINEAKALTSLCCSAAAKGPSETKGPSAMKGKWISLACKSSEVLNSGESIEDYLRWLEDSAPFIDQFAVEETLKSLNNLAVGVNCCDPFLVTDVLATIKEFSRKGRPLVAYPNTGKEWCECAGNGKERGYYIDSSGLSDHSFAILAEEWAMAGAKVIGSCCTSTPNTTRYIALQLHKEK